MAQQYPIVWLPEEPGHVNIAKLAPHSPLCLAPNRRLWKTQDTIPGQARRVLAEYGLMGSSSWAVPAGTADPDQVSQVYPERNTWRTVAVSTALLTPGCKLEMRALFCPAGLTQWNNGSTWLSGGTFAELRARVHWFNAGNFEGPHDFVLSMPGSGHGTWGGAENTLAGADWADLDERVVYDIMPPDYESDPAVAVLFADGTTAAIELQVRGGERIVHAIVYEVPSVHVQLHSTSGAQMVHGAPQGDPPTPRRPQTDAADGGGFQNHRHGTTRALHAAARQGARLGPRILNFAANSHSGSAWNTTIQTPIAIAGAVTLANLFDTTLTTYDTTHPGWIVAGSMAQLHRLNSSNYLRGRACVIPVKIMLDASCPVQPATLRLQSSALEWVDVPIPAARGQVFAYGYLASQVYGDHFAGILQARITVPAATTANIYNINVEFCEEDEDSMASLLSTFPSVLATFAADAGPTATTTATNMVDVNIPANTLDADGQALHVELFGDLLNTSGVGVTWEVAVLLGGVELFRDTSGSYASSASVRVWTKKFIITRKSATTCQLGGHYGWETTGTAPDTGLGGIDSGKNSSNTRSPATSPTVAWGSSQDLEVRITCSSNHASTRYTLRGGYVMKIPNAS